MACPHAGDMARTRPAFAGRAWAVAAKRRFQHARGIRLALRRLLGEPAYARGARELRDWSALNDGAATAADVPEAYTPVG